MIIDVIIPIYNAYEYVIECVNSLYRYTDIKNFHLYLIDDCSPDQRIQEYLNSIDKSLPNLNILYNEENLGFVGTVNKGMKCSKHDVILLNSDTEVTPNWLNKMIKAAYSDTNIATVTALTNSGTICSVPNFCEDNKLPKEYEFLDEYANDIEHHALALYPEAPTGVGFCMYIKRSVIDEIGYFDEEHFGKGYGEENDFCCRCIEHGYKNIIDDTTFIYHKGSASFSGKKAEYSANNSIILGELYPYYFNDVARFIEANPLLPVQEMVKLQIILKKRKKNILYLLHNDFIEGRNHPYGGTEIHVRDLIEGMKEEHNAFVLTPHENFLYLDIFAGDYINTMRFELKNAIQMCETHNHEYQNIMSAVLNYFNIQLLHIHHFKGHTFDSVYLAKEMNIPVFYTIHDYSCLCPRINLLYDGDVYCRFLRSEETCNSCIHKGFGYRFLAKTWREHYAHLLDEFDQIFYPDASVLENIVSFYKDFNLPLNYERMKCIPHGKFSKMQDFIHIQSQNKRFKICIFGGVSKHKGSKYLRQLIEQNTGFEWYILGNVYDLDIESSDNVHIHGAYEQNEILDLLQVIHPDIALNLSICPETFSYVLSEAFIAGIPVIGTNLGAFGNRIKNDENGWKVSYPIDLDEIQSLLEELSANPEKLKAVKQQKKEIIYVEDMVESYKHVYYEYQCNILYDHTVEQNRLISNAMLQEQKEEIEIENYVPKESYQELLQHIEEIHNSTSWKILKWINHHVDKIKGLFKS